MGSTTSAIFPIHYSPTAEKPSRPAALLGKKKIFRLKINTAFRTFIRLIRWRDGQFSILDPSLTNVIKMSTGMFGIQWIIFIFENHDLPGKRKLTL